MKKLYTLLIVSLLCLCMTGCAKNNKFCQNFKLVPYIYKPLYSRYSKPVTEQYRKQEIDYFRYCKVLPALNNFQFNNELGEKLKILHDSYTHEPPIFKTDREYYKVFRELSAYVALNILATIPQNVNHYEEIMDKDEEFKEYVEVLNHYGDNHKLKEYVNYTYYQYKKSGAFDDYRIADIFIKRILKIIDIYEFYSYSDYENIITEVATYNENKKNARMTLEFLGQHFWNDPNHYKKTRFYK